MPNQRRADAHTHGIHFPDDLWRRAQERAERLGLRSTGQYVRESVEQRLDQEEEQ